LKTDSTTTFFMASEKAKIDVWLDCDPGEYLP
jgi:hypothetical protein